MLADGTGALVLEGPYYGARRPPGQSGSKLLHVSDLLNQGCVTIMESLLLLRMLRAAGVPKLGVTGWSMGGVHACMVASLYEGDLATVSFMAPRSAADAYCEGALSRFTALPALRGACDSNGVVRACSPCIA